MGLPLLNFHTVIDIDTLDIAVCKGLTLSSEIISQSAELVF